VTSYGGNPFSLSVPGLVVGKIRYGINGHVHYIGAVFRMPLSNMGQQFPMQQMNMPQMNMNQMNMPFGNQYGAPFNNQSNANQMYPNMSLAMSIGMPNTNFMSSMNTMMIEPSMKVGGVNPDTIPFDDYNSVLMSMIQQGKYVEISEITIISSHQNVFGIKVDYRVIDQSGNHMKLEQKHHGSAQHQNFGVQHHMHKFHNGEQIIEIYGRSGAIIDQLYIKTSHGKTIGGGGQGGNPFMIPLPQGRRFFAFGGGTNGHLHNLFVYHSP